jgi:hypothetical protein
MSFIFWLFGVFILLGGLLNIGNLFFNYYGDDESILKEKINFEDLADYHLTLGISLSFIGSWMAGYLELLSFFLLFLILFITYRFISIEKIKDSKEKEVPAVEGSSKKTEEIADFTEWAEKLTDLLAKLGQRIIDFMSNLFNDYSNLKKNRFFLSSVTLSLLIIVFNIGSSSNTSSNNYDSGDMEIYNIPGTSITTSIYSGENACPVSKKSLQANVDKIYKIATKGMSKKEKRKFLDQSSVDNYIVKRCISCLVDKSMKGKIAIGDRTCERAYKDYQASVGIKWVDGIKVKEY